MASSGRAGGFWPLPFKPVEPRNPGLGIACLNGRRQPIRSGQVVHSHLSGRWPAAARDLRPQARCSVGNPRQLPFHRHPDSGSSFCETLPYTAKVAHRLSVIRSMTTEIDAHSTSGAFMLTGYEPQTKAENVPPGPQDWPSIASVVGMLKPSTRSPMTSVVLPEPWPMTATSYGPGKMADSWGLRGIRCSCDATPRSSRCKSRV